MRKDNILKTLLAFVMMAVAAGCTETYEEFDSGNVRPTKIEAGEVISVNSYEAYIAFGTDNAGGDLRGEWADYYNQIRLEVSTNPDCPVAEGEDDSQADPMASDVTVSRDNGRWHVTGLRQGTTYYYREYCTDLRGYAVKSPVKQFTTEVGIEIDVDYYGKTESQYQFDITIKNFRGTPTRIGMYYSYSLDMVSSSWISKQDYSYNSTPSNPTGESPWLLYFNISRSGFTYNNSAFYYCAYIYHEGHYYLSPVKWVNP